MTIFLEGDSVVHAALFETNIDRKVQAIGGDVHQALCTPESLVIPDVPGRSILVLDLKLHPPKKGLSSPEGLARLLHDLANIELQAMELALRTLIEFPQAHPEFREQLAELVLSESEHLQLCLSGLRQLGFEWGDWPAHLGLWSCVSETDSLLDRLLIVHRYLEGSGLDAGETLLRKLSGVQQNTVQQVVKTILTDEVEHVHFGSTWYRIFCEQEGLDPDSDFRLRFGRLKSVLPRRLEKIVPQIRIRAGFSEAEIQVLEEFRRQQM